jgi:Family of unknown function (DUF5685)
MYGLMRARHCALSIEQSERHRFHYCGTCKTIGRLYGHRARLLLNHDAVFLAELLSFLSVEPSPRNADKAFHSYNCLSLPKSYDKIPLALQWAAAANLMLARFKVADRIKDNGQIRWRLIRASRRLGYDFGRLIYLLDAFDDYEKDWRKGEFNALRAAFGWTTERLTSEQRRQAQDALLEIRDRIVNRLFTMPVPESYAKLFPEQLDDNLSRKIVRPLPVLNPKSRACQKRRLTLAERWGNAVSFSRRMMRQGDGSWLKASLAFIFVLAVVFLFPYAASRLKTWRDCWSLGFNLMFLSALPGAVLAVMTPIPFTVANEKKENRASHCRECWGECCGDSCVEGC